MATTNKFSIGQSVNYSLTGETVLFSGLIIGINEDATKKPYVIKTESGEVKFANEEYLTVN